MIIFIGKEEYEFDIFKLDAVIEGLAQYRDHKDSTLEWLRRIV